MEIKKVLCITCKECQTDIFFSTSDLVNLSCQKCGFSYSDISEKVIKDLEQFERLCQQILLSKNILSNISVGVDVDGKKATIPYKLLLTRLFATLDLNNEATPLSVDFRRHFDDGTLSDQAVEVQFLADKFVEN